jgi:hypothetical protein
MTERREIRTERCDGMPPVGHNAHSRTNYGAETVSLLRGLPAKLAVCPEYVPMGQIMIQEGIRSTLHRAQMWRTIASVRSGT